jgi:hypothetical protein
MYRFSYLGAISILLIPPAVDTEDAAKDGGTLEYVFEAGEQNNSRDGGLLTDTMPGLRFGSGLRYCRILSHPGPIYFMTEQIWQRIKKLRFRFSAFNSAKIASV